jgi:hypothetical protein
VARRLVARRPVARIPRPAAQRAVAQRPVVRRPVARRNPQPVALRPVALRAVPPRARPAPTAGDPLAMKAIALVALLAAAGCSRKSSVDCETAIARGTDSLVATVKARSASKQMTDSMKELAGKMRTALTRRCSEDKWSPEAVECFGKLVSPAGMQGCESKLSAEQLTRMRKDLVQATASMQTLGAGPGHPPTLAGSAGPSEPSEPTGAPSAPASAGSSSGR